MKHTPAPWKTVPSKTRPVSYRIVDVREYGNGSICEIAHVYSRPSAIADAALIAAAPELLSALEALVNVLSDDVNDYPDSSAYFNVKDKEEAARKIIARIRDTSEG